MISNVNPSLIDTSTFNYMYDNLLSCHTKRVEYYSKYLNLYELRVQIISV